MINSSDIRAGNWVIKITGRYTDMQSFYEYKAVAIDEYYYTFSKYCFPIRISSKVLEESGFRQDHDYWYIAKEAENIDDSSRLLKFKKKDELWYIKDYQIPSQPQYLHELQNLFYALFKTELDIHLSAFENLANKGHLNYFVERKISD